MFSTPDEVHDARLSFFCISRIRRNVGNGVGIDPNTANYFEFGHKGILSGSGKSIAGEVFFRVPDTL